jgi:enamine deaminase RidA (YjgF/YER057c/UK114 family)
MATSREEAMRRIAAEVGFNVDAEIRVGGNYVPFIVTGSTIHVSGQISRVSDAQVLSGRAGAGVSLAQAQKAAKVSALRALAVLRKAAGDLERIKSIAHMTVFTQCSEDFTLQSEVADGASDTLVAVLGDAGRHTRTSIGVYQIPKNATVELELVATTG